MPIKTNTGLPERNLWGSLWVGFNQKCPNCHSGKVFGKYLKVKERCDECGQELHHHRADDAPPYFTIFILGHIMLPMMFFINRLYDISTTKLLAIILSLTVILALLLLPRIKGALVGLQWSLYMHGFEDDARRNNKG